MKSLYATKKKVVFNLNLQCESKSRNIGNMLNKIHLLEWITAKRLRQTKEYGRNVWPNSNFYYLLKISTLQFLGFYVQ